MRTIKVGIIGTGFIGPGQVRYAVGRGHEVTIFNRGKSAPGMFTGVEELTGDRAAAPSYSGHELPAVTFPSGEIGRASCRERVSTLV